MCSRPFEFNKNAATTKKMEKTTMLLVLKDIFLFAKKTKKKARDDVLVV